MFGYGNRGTGDWKSVVVTVCFLSILGPVLNGGLLDVNFAMLDLVLYSGIDLTDSNMSNFRGRLAFAQD